MGRRKKTQDGVENVVVDRMYFTTETEDAIVTYNASTNPHEREEIYRSQIAKPFDKLAENIINRFKFPYINMSFDALKRDVVAFLIMNLQKYKQANGKAFSYFSVCAKNYLILLNDNAYKEHRRSVFIAEDYTSLDEVMGLEAPNDRVHDDSSEFVSLMVTYWERNIHLHFKKKRDVDIAHAVIELFRRADGIENFNKKALYLLIREMTDHKTGYITKVVNKMKEITMEHLREFNSEGTVDGETNGLLRYE